MQAGAQILQIHPTCRGIMLYMGNNAVHGQPNNNVEGEHEQHDDTYSLMEMVHGWGSDDSYHSDASQNTWSR